MHLPLTLDQTLTAVRASIEQMSSWGCQGVECADQTQAMLKRWSQPVQPAGTLEGLNQIERDLDDCRRCDLCDQRTCIVFGQGNPKARLVFVGTAPGVQEDESGKPFTGPAGQLLIRIIEAMKLTRDQVYLCNLIKCCPHPDRPISTAQINACRPFLERQLAAVQPEVICALGDLAAQTLTQNSQPVVALRGRFFDFKGIKVMPTLDLAHILRHAEYKRDVWEDMKKIMALLRLPL